MARLLIPALVVIASILAACCFRAIADEPADAAAKPAAAGDETPAASEKPAANEEREEPAAASDDPAAEGEEAAASEDEEGVRQSAEIFTQAFNAGDAETIAGQFTEKAEYVTEDGRVFSGREAIGEDYSETFQRFPGIQIETNVESIRFLGKGVAVEKGTTSVTMVDGEEPIEGSYTVLHVNTGQGWQIAYVKETSAPQLTNYHRLKELEWMVGEWVDEGEDSLVVTKCEWSKNKNYLLQTFNVRIAGRDAVEGTTRIGWDPVEKMIRSWTFDTEGGYAQGVWTNEENRWIVKSTGVVRDGRTASATHMFTYVDEGTFTWMSVDRIIGGEMTPDIEAMTIVRRPPAPE